MVGGTGDEASLLLAWVGNWSYARRTPTLGFRGSLSLPKRLSLIDTLEGPRPVQRAEPAVAAAFERHAFGDRPVRPSTGTYCLDAVLELDRGERASPSLFGETAPRFTLERDASSATAR